MGNVTKITDSLKNFMAKLNTGQDKQSFAFYADPDLTDQQLLNAYRTSWMAKKTVDLPAKDATRKWREWQSDVYNIQKLENEESRLLLPQRVNQAMIEARLYGGAAIYICIKGDDPSTPLEPDSVGLRGIEFLTVMSRRVLTPGQLETDPMRKGYGLPKHYTVSGSSSYAKIDPSRLVLLYGAKLPDPEDAGGLQYGWADSVLTSAFAAVRNADSVAANIASLVYESKVDVLSIPGLADIMSDSRTREMLVERVQLCSMLKSNNAMLVIDGEEDYDSKSFNFAGLPDIERQALQAVSGAADIPVTRFLGQTPSGLSSTGEADLKNYYDGLASMQSLELTPALHVLDECLIRSALGNRDPAVHYEWASLWQMSDAEKSKISKETAETIKILADTALFPDDALSAAAANMLMQHSTMPATELQINVDDEPDEKALVIDSSKPRSLYVMRKVVNSKDLIAWAKKQGFENTLPANEMHVTVAFSRALVDWTDIGYDWTSDERGRVMVKPGGPRLVETLGDKGAKVLIFASDDLEYRHESIINCGASWDYDGYTPHITLTYGDMPEGVEPYRGPIVLGPEIFEEINDDYADDLQETKP